ncbi:uncharacterized protein LOC144127609 [Amblyomma americanum]
MDAAISGSPFPLTTEATAAPSFPLAASVYATAFLSRLSSPLAMASALFFLLSLLNSGCIFLGNGSTLIFSLAHFGMSCFFCIPLSVCLSTASSIALPVLVLLSLSSRTLHRRHIRCPSYASRPCCRTTAAFPLIAYRRCGSICQLASFLSAFLHSFSMVLCAIVGCSNRSDSSRRKKKPTNTNFYRIPRIIADKCERSKTLSTNRRTLWLSRIKRADLDPDNPNLRVCGAHFTTGAPADLFDNTNPDWAPSLHLGYSTRRVGSDRHDCSQQRRQRKRRAETEMTGSEKPCGVAAPVPDVPPSPHQAEEVDAEETGESALHHAIIALT